MNGGPPVSEMDQRTPHPHQRRCTDQAEPNHQRCTRSRFDPNTLSGLAAHHPNELSRTFPCLARFCQCRVHCCNGSNAWGSNLELIPDEMLVACSRESGDSSQRCPWRLTHEMKLNHRSQVSGEQVPQEIGQFPLPQILPVRSSSGHSEFPPSQRRWKCRATGRDPSSRLLVCGHRWPWCRQTCRCRHNSVRVIIKVLDWGTHSTCTRPAAVP